MDEKESESSKKQHLLQKHGILSEFDIISVTSLESFMNTYDKIANSPDDISELANVNTPRCTSCHIQLILNITLGSCSIM